MKVGVYAIAKDEAHHVRRWAASAQEADAIYLLDTGSSDGTPEMADALGVLVSTCSINPWRFDVARNQALALTDPSLDYLIALDLDEVLIPGWRQHLEQMHDQGITRPRYQYTWSWDGPRPGLQYGGDKIHTRHGYYWKHPVHEVITPYPDFVETQGWCGLEIHHYADNSKSRAQYLPLLELGVREDPHDDRLAHYYARELFFQGDHARAECEFQRHLSLPTAVWDAERAQSYRYLFKITSDAGYLLAAWREAPHMREAAVDLARWYYGQNQWFECLTWAKRALKISERPLAYLTEPEAWGSLPHDLAAIAAYQLELFHEAAWHGLKAINLSPYNRRLWENQRWYEQAASRA